MQFNPSFTCPWAQRSTKFNKRSKLGEFTLGFSALLCNYVPCQSYFPSAKRLYRKLSYEFINKTSLETNRKLNSSLYSWQNDVNRDDYYEQSLIKSS